LYISSGAKFCSKFFGWKNDNWSTSANCCKVNSKVWSKRSHVKKITNIVGNGIDGIVIVTIPNTNILKDGEIVSISATTNFNVTNVPLSIIDGTTFSYNLGTVGDATPETSGTATTQGEFLIVFINIAPETTPLLDLVGLWEYFGKVQQTDSGVFATSESVVFHVISHKSEF